MKLLTIGTSTRNNIAEFAPQLELLYNISGMSQFYMRFIRFSSTEYKDIYFLNYTGSLKSNLLQMVLAKEKINLFIKGQDTDLDQIYEKFNVDYHLLVLLMCWEADDEGKFLSAGANRTLRKWLLHRNNNLYDKSTLFVIRMMPKGPE